MLEPHLPNPRNEIPSGYLLTALGVVSAVLLIVIMILVSERPSKLHFPENEAVEKPQYIDRHH